MVSTLNADVKALSLPMATGSHPPAPHAALALAPLSKLTDMGCKSMGAIIAVCGALGCGRHTAPAGSGGGEALKLWLMLRASGIIGLVDEVAMTLSTLLPVARRRLDNSSREEASSMTASLQPQPAKSSGGRRPPPSLTSTGNPVADPAPLFAAIVSSTAELLRLACLFLRSLLRLSVQVLEEETALTPTATSSTSASSTGFSSGDKNGAARGASNMGKTSPPPVAAFDRPSLAKEVCSFLGDILQGEALPPSLSHELSLFSLITGSDAVHFAWRHSRIWQGPARRQADDPAVVDLIAALPSAVSEALTACCLLATSFEDLPSPLSLALGKEVQGSRGNDEGEVVGSVLHGAFDRLAENAELMAIHGARFSNLLLKGRGAWGEGRANSGSPDNGAETSNRPPATSSHAASIFQATSSLLRTLQHVLGYERSLLSIVQNSLSPDEDISLWHYVSWKPETWKRQGFLEACCDWAFLSSAFHWMVSKDGLLFIKSTRESAQLEAECDHDGVGSAGGNTICVEGSRQEALREATAARKGGVHSGLAWFAKLLILAQRRALEPVLTSAGGISLQCCCHSCPSSGAGRSARSLDNAPSMGAWSHRKVCSCGMWFCGLECQVQARASGHDQACRFLQACLAGYIMGPWARAKEALMASEVIRGASQLHWAHRAAAPCTPLTSPGGAASDCSLGDVGITNSPSGDEPGGRAYDGEVFATVASSSGMKGLPLTASSGDGDESVDGVGGRSHSFVNGAAGNVRSFCNPVSPEYAKVLADPDRSNLGVAGKFEGFPLSLIP